jgi:hypothetical protein
VVPKVKQDGETKLIEDIEVPNMSLRSCSNVNQVGPIALAFVDEVVAFELVVRV